MTLSSSPGVAGDLSAVDAQVISVIIPNYDGLQFLASCLSSLLAQEIPAQQLEIWFIDNGSHDGSAEFVRRNFPAVRVIANAVNRGFTQAINQGIAVASGAWILLLNNDTELEAGALRALVNYMQRADSEVAGVQPLLLWAGDREIVDSAGIVLGKRFGAHDHLHGKSVALAPATVAETWGICFACALIRRAAFERVGPLDEDFFAEWDDVEFATRARWLGYRFLLLPDARVRHHRSPTSQRDSISKFIRLRRNRVLTFIKCLPRRMAWGLVLYRAQYDLGMLLHYKKEKQLAAVARSWWDVLRLTPRMLARRGAWKRLAKLSDRQMTEAIQQATRDG